MYAPQMKGRSEKLFKNMASFPHPLKRVVSGKDFNYISGKGDQVRSHQEAKYLEFIFRNTKIQDALNAYSDNLKNSLFKNKN